MKLKFKEIINIIINKNINKIIINNNKIKTI